MEFFISGPWAPKPLDFENSARRPSTAFGGRNPPDVRNKAIKKFQFFQDLPDRASRNGLQENGEIRIPAVVTTGKTSLTRSANSPVGVSM